MIYFLRSIHFLPERMLADIINLYWWQSRNIANSAFYGQLKYSILTHRYLCALNCILGVFTLLKGVHMHSIMFKGCSQSLKGIHMHSITFRCGTYLTQCLSYACDNILGMFIVTQKYSHALYHIQ